MTAAASGIHKEASFEDYIVAALCNEAGYKKRSSAWNYDRKAAVDKGVLIEFLKATQPDEWAKLLQHYNSSAEETLVVQLAKALKDHGTLEVLRSGLKIVPGIRFQLMYLRPASGLDPKAEKLFQANVLSVIQQLQYSTKNENAIDLALFVNGIPVATAELKNELTGTNFRHAEKQYRKDRIPAGEPLLEFGRGALVHFAMDTNAVSMTTRLQGGKTTFLPFNRGRNGGAGNPDVSGEFATCYMWREIWGREVWLDILGRFMHLQVDKKKQPGGKTVTKKTMIFPRFHQLDSVLKTLAHVKANGAGHNYLYQHSAGSGKSNNIAWTAHRLSTLHDDKDQAIFDTVIVVTDRVVLDRQLQDTISKFQQTPGYVRVIDGTSRDLAKAIADGAKIVVSTIQKFSTDRVQELKTQAGKKFAIIVDEAHSSQAGEHSSNMQRVLSMDAIDDLIETDERAEAVQEARGPRRNISFFAFTATPRQVTLEIFGWKGNDGRPAPFHTYSMRQAIEEGFILDVLKNYTTYQAYYSLEKAIEDDPDLDERRAARKIARWASLHPHNISQKTEMVIEHFRRHVAGLLDGKAKAMVATSSREHAYRYYRAFKAYIAEKGYTDVDALVAFSGDLKVDGHEYTEAQLNGFAESELPEHFAEDDYQVLIVAEKYQTGFDQPLLCAMYIDKKLAGLQAVQTLSRLNRTYPGKDETFILDFQNAASDIQDAFAPYYEVTEIEEASDPNQIYMLQQKVMSFGFIDPADIEQFAALFYKAQLDQADRPVMEALVKAAVDRFKVETDEDVREEFRQYLSSYRRFYAFLSQVVALGDADLEKLYSYAGWLQRMLPRREGGEEIEITDEMLKMQAYRVEMTSQGDASLQPGVEAPLKPISEFGPRPLTEDEHATLSEIIDRFNERFGTDFTEADFLQCERVNTEILKQESVREQLRNNDPDVAFSAYSKLFIQELVKVFQRDQKLKSALLQDKNAREDATKFFFSRALREVRDQE